MTAARAAADTVAAASSPAPTATSRSKGVRSARGLPNGFDVVPLVEKGWKTSPREMASAGMAGIYAVRPSADHFIAYGDLSTPRATADGFEFDVTCYTRKGGDEIALFLQVPLYDTKSRALTYFNLDLLTYDPTTKALAEKITTRAATDPVSKTSCLVGRRTYRFALAQLNAFLADRGAPVAIKPGDMLAVSGFIKDDGHRIMTPASNAFAVPAPKSGAGVSAVAVRAHAEAVGRAADLPLDISIELPHELLDERIWIGGQLGAGGVFVPAHDFTVGSVLEGEITTRLESEYKGSVSARQLAAMISKAYELAELSYAAERGDARARRTLDRELGEDLALEAVQRHWLAKDGEPIGERDASRLEVARDEHGWPKLDPMRDGYSDDQALTFSKVSGAARVRGNAQKQGHAEFKLSGGVLDAKTGIRQRVEIGFTLRPGATEEQLESIFAHIREHPASKLGSSPLGHIVREAQKLGVAGALTADRTPWADLTQLRHKFEVKNTKTGTKVELSLDHVHAKTLRKEHEKRGAPQQATYYVIETELDHLQIDSAHVTKMKSTASKVALTSAKEQDDFVAEASKKAAAGQAAYEILACPQLHSDDHIKEGSFRETASYQDFAAMNAALLAALCGAKLPGPARQKSAHFAELIGLVPPEDTVTVA